MRPSQILVDKSLNAKQKAARLAEIIPSQSEVLEELIEFAAAASDSRAAVILEAMEYSSREAGASLTGEALDFVISCLSAPASSVKREAARVVGNTIRHHPGKAESAVTALLRNSEDDGTVVRWAAAYALGEILRLRLPLNRTLIPQTQKIAEREEKSSIQKTYRTALKDLES